jgi:hypothetical protein
MTDNELPKWMAEAAAAEAADAHKRIDSLGGHWEAMIVRSLPSRASV